MNHGEVVFCSIAFVPCLSQCFLGLLEGGSSFIARNFGCTLCFVRFLPQLFLLQKGSSFALGSKPFPFRQPVQGHGKRRNDGEAYQHERAESGSERISPQPLLQKLAMTGSASLDRLAGKKAIEIIGKFSWAQVASSEIFLQTFGNDDCQFVRYMRSVFSNRRWIGHEDLLHDA